MAVVSLYLAQHQLDEYADKERLYAEIQRVLRPGGRLALHEILAGPVSPIYIPVPWAREPGLSHLRPPEEVRNLLKEMGFEEVAWIDETAPALRWHQVRNLRERRISVVQGVFEKSTT